MITQDHLSDFALDRLMTGELDGSPQRLAMRTHLDACPACGARETQLARSAEAFAALRAARPATATRILEAATARRRLSPRAWWGGLAAVSAVAATLLLLARTPGGGDERRIKGGLSLDAFVKRANGTVERVHAGGRVSAGDHVQFGIAAPFDGYLDIVSVDSAGELMSYMPGGAPVWLTLSDGRRHWLDGSIELDETLGNERVFAFHCRDRVDGGQMWAAVRGALAAAGGDPKNATIAQPPRTCFITTLWFEKVPRP